MGEQQRPDEMLFLFRVNNHRTFGCGTPPQIDDEAQAVIRATSEVYSATGDLHSCPRRPDRKKQMGDVDGANLWGWARTAPGLIFSHMEALWLHKYRLAATGETPRLSGKK
jgi:hypothetical protein